MVRAIQNRLNDPPTPVEMGFLFETWFVRELRRLRDYEDKAHEFSFWCEGTHEIDLLITGGHGPLLAIECKTGRDLISAQTLRAFRARFPKVPLVIASLHDQLPRRLESGIDLLPWSKVLQAKQGHGAQMLDDPDFLAKLLDWIKTRSSPQ